MEDLKIIICDVGNAASAIVKVPTGYSMMIDCGCNHEKNIGWQQLLQRVPKNHTVAVKVCTNLVGLTDKKINALIEHSEWMTEVQVRMHLPFLLKNN